MAIKELLDVMTCREDVLYLIDNANNQWIGTIPTGHVPKEYEDCIVSGLSPDALGDGNDVLLKVWVEAPAEDPLEKINAPEDDPSDTDEAIRNARRKLKRVFGDDFPEA